MARKGSTIVETLCVAALASLVPAAAQATVSITCSDMKSDSSLDVVLGAGPVPNVFSVHLSVGGREFTTEPALPGEPVTIAQAYDDGELFRIDLVDDQATKRVAVIRLLNAGHDAMPLRIGFLQIENDPPVGVSCIGP